VAREGSCGESEVSLVSSVGWEVQWVGAVASSVVGAVNTSGSDRRGVVSARDKGESQL
jgi:hypothetical protein